MSRFGALFFKHDVASGAARYDDEYPGNAHQARVVVWLSLPDGLEIPAVLDTGAPWCILNPESLPEVAMQGPGLVRRLVVRGEEYEGRMVRIPLVLRADEGYDLRFEATVFIPQLYPGESWPHPNFLGLSSALDRIRVTIDPGENFLYFRSIG